jgi:hypothetical protein
VTDLDPKLKLVHFRNADNLNVGFRVEVAAIVGIPEEALYLQFQKVDVLERSSKVAEDRDLLPHGLASGNVFNPQSVQDNVGNLDGFSVGNSLEYGVKKRDVLDGEHLGGNIYAITDIVRVFSEQEDAGTKNLLSSGSEDEG